MAIIGLVGHGKWFSDFNGDSLEGAGQRAN